MGTFSVYTDKQKKKLQTVLFKNLFFKVIPVQIEHYENIYKDDKKNPKILKMDPIYRVLFCRTCGGSDRFTIITTEFDGVTHGIENVCCKILVNYTRLHGYDGWKDKVQGKVYRIIPKVNVKLFLERLKTEKYWTWKKMIDYLSDGTGQADERIKNVIQSLVIKIPIGHGWQPHNNHFLAITNSAAGKTEIFRRLTGFQSPKSYTDSGLFGGMSKDGMICDGELKGEGAAVFDEYLKKYREDQVQMMSNCLTYMTQGTTIRVLVGSPITCVGTKTLCFFANPPKDDNNLPGFSNALFPLCGQDSVDAAGTRLGHILYGSDFNVITSSEQNDELTKNIRFIIREMEKVKRRTIISVLNHYKTWISTPDKEYEAFWPNVGKYSTETSLKRFFDYFSYSWKRLKLGAIRRAILLNLDRLFEMNVNSFIKLIDNEVKLFYEQFKTYNYRSFEHLFHNKKATAIKLMSQGFNYNEAIATGQLHDVSISTWNNWSWEFKKDKRELPESY